MAVPQLGDPGATGSPSPVQHIALLQLDHCCLAMLVIAQKTLGAEGRPPCDDVTVSPCDDVTVSPSDDVTVSPCDDVTVSPCDDVTVSSFDDVAVSPCDDVSLGEFQIKHALCCLA
ncbi:unnamed protein product [Arctogadus glacialis]